MAYTEVNMREGIPDGGMPFETSLWRMEETDPNLVLAAQADRPGAFIDFSPEDNAEIRPYGDGDYDHGEGTGYDDGGGYDGYARAEIIDWTPDPAYLESGQQRRDPSLSRSQINVRYNGNRGNYDYLPQHPEIFIGFTDNDPRGSLTDPLLNQARGQMLARAETLTVRMGDNDKNHVAERPWTNQSLSYSKKEIQRRVHKNMKIFSPTREGRPWGRNMITDENRFSHGQNERRRDAIKTGDEGLITSTGGSENARFSRGDSMAAPENSLGPRRADGGISAGAADMGAGHWRNASGSMKLGKGSMATARGMGAATPTGASGTLVQGAESSAPWSTTAVGRAANRKILAASAAIAAKFRKAERSSRPDQAAAESFLAKSVGQSNSQKDAGRAHRQTTQDGSTARYLGTVSDGTAASRGQQGLTPTQSSNFMTSSTTTQNVHLTNAEAIAKGLREGSASSKRKIADKVALSGFRAGERTELALGTSAGLKDTSNAIRKTNAAPVMSAAASRGLTVHSYKSKAPEIRQEVAMGQGAFDPRTTWKGSKETTMTHIKNPEWRGGKSDATIGQDDSELFGTNSSTANPSVTLGKGVISLRANQSSHSASLFDGVNEEELEDEIE